MSFVLNGRFLTRPPTGVDRVATELMRAFLLREEAQSFRCRVPKPGLSAGLETLPKRLAQRVEISQNALRGQLWEQFSLPFETAGDRLVSLCNLGPIALREQAVMFHDAQAFTRPESYAPAFRKWYHTVQPRLARRVRLLLTVSAFSARELEALEVVPKGKARVVHNGADHILRHASDPDILSKFGLQTQGFFLAIGSLAPHKNLQMLVKAARQRNVGAPPLVIVGSGNARVFGAEGLSDGGGVRLIGRVSDAQLRGLYENALALLFPSRTEGFGLPPMEAMMCGCPVVAAPRGALPEICRQAACYVDPDDPEAWRVAMEKIAGCALERCERAEAGRAQSAAFTWKAAAERFAAHLDAAGLSS